MRTEHLFTDAIAAKSKFHTSAKLVVVADDFGIGPQVSRGILHLAKQRLLSASVLLVNSPFAQDGVNRWQNCGKPMTLGWHACLTMDAPILPSEHIPSLVDQRGRFYHLMTFVRRLSLGMISLNEIIAELEAQLTLFRDLIGEWPRIINGHHHVHEFPIVRRAMSVVLEKYGIRPYIRSVRPSIFEDFSMSRIIKRMGLCWLRSLSKNAYNEYMSTNGQLYGFINDCRPEQLIKKLYRHMKHANGYPIEWMCHPGYYDATLLGRDTNSTSDLCRREAELECLSNRHVAHFLSNHLMGMPTGEDYLPWNEKVAC